MTIYAFIITGLLIFTTTMWLLEKKDVRFWRNRAKQERESRKYWEKKWFALADFYTKRMGDQ